MMAREEKFPELLAELVERLGEILLSDKYRIKDKDSFNKNRQLDLTIFDIYVHELYGKPEYEGMIAEFLKAEKEEQYAFDRRLRDRLYEVLQKARSGLKWNNKILHKSLKQIFTFSKATNLLTDAVTWSFQNQKLLF